MLYASCWKMRWKQSYFDEDEAFVDKVSSAKILLQKHGCFKVGFAFALILCSVKYRDS